jgi:AmmeMemoRadiSam system protein B
VAKKYADSTVELLKYGTSYDTCSDSNTCVGYAALAIKK